MTRLLYLHCWQFTGNPTRDSHARLNEQKWDGAQTEEKHPVFSFFIAVKRCNINRITSILDILLAHHKNVHPQQVHTECKKEKKKTQNPVTINTCFRGAQGIVLLVTFWVDLEIHNGGSSSPQPFGLHFPPLCFRVKMWEGLGWKWKQKTHYVHTQDTKKECVNSTAEGGSRVIR